MSNARVFHLRLSEDIPLQKETQAVIESIPRGRRTMELCRMILSAKEKTELRQLITETIEHSVQASLSKQTLLPQPNTAPPGEEVTSDLLSFLSDLQNGGEPT